AVGLRGWGGGLASGGGEEVSLRQVLGLLWRRKWFLAFLTMLAAGAAMVWVSSQTPRYTARTAIYFTQNRSQVVDMDSVVASSPLSKAVLQSEMEVIRSQKLLNRVVEDLDLMNDPLFNAALRPPEVGRVARAVQQGVAALKAEIKPLVSDWIDWPEPSVAAPPPVRSSRGAASLAPDRLRVIAALQEAVRVRPLGQSFVIQLFVETEDPHRSAEIANTIAQQYIVDQLEAKFEATAQATAWLTDRVVALRGRVEEAETAVERFRAQSGLVGTETRDKLAEDLAQAESRLAAIDAETLRLDTRLAALSAGLDQRSYTGLGDVLSTPAGRQAWRGLVEQNGGTGAETALRRQIEAEIARVEAERSAAQDRRRLLMRSVGTLKAETERNTGNLVRLRQLERDAEATRLVYEALLARAKETSQQEGLEQADARVLEEARVPPLPSYPRKSRIVTLGALLGFVAGLGLIVLLERMRTTFRDAEEVERALGLPVMGQIPVVPGKRERRQIVRHCVQEPNGALAEAVRFLRSAILLSNVDHQDSSLSVLLTSALPGEGKSTTALLLAQTSAQLGYRTIIVDCDMRRPTLHHTTAIDNTHNLITVVAGESDLGETIQRDEETGLDVLVGARAAANAADFVSSESFRRTMATLREHYELIILDAPPILAVPDAKIIGRDVDTVLHVIHWNKTPKDAVDTATKLFQDSGTPITGCVIAHLDARKAAKYSYGKSSYAYTYKQNQKYYGA
ncbi:MAG: polysaccharide biosynthesis tyrosine autokinase, partial [Pseudomonadota bacterium]